MSITHPPISRFVPRPPRVLFVDDDGVALRALSRLMRGALPDWQATLTNSAVGALSALGRQTFDVMVTDLDMPAMDGIQLLRLVQARDPDVIRIVHSGKVESFPEVVELAFRVLTKPTDPEELVATLEEAVAQRHSLAIGRRTS